LIYNMGKLEGEAGEIMGFADNLSNSYARGDRQKISIRNEWPVSIGALPLSKDRAPSSDELASRENDIRAQLNNGPLDAFRHTLAAALLTQKFGAQVVSTLGALREDDDPSGSMDLYNNRAGITIGVAYPNASRQEIIDHVWQAFKDGKLQLHSSPLPNYKNLKE